MNPDPRHGGSRDASHDTSLVLARRLRVQVLVFYAIVLLVAVGAVLSLGDRIAGSEALYAIVGVVVLLIVLAFVRELVVSRERQALVDRFYAIRGQDESSRFQLARELFELRREYEQLVQRVGDADAEGQ